jgi:hypothetical protein
LRATAYAAIGTSAIVIVVKANVFVLAHAWVVPRAAESKKLPAVVESQNDTCDRVSDVPPLVHEPDIDDIDTDPAAGAANVTVLRVVSPAAAALVPADPGSAVWSFAANTVGAVNAVPRNMSSHLFAKLVALKPAVTGLAPFVVVLQEASQPVLR